MNPQWLEERQWLQRILETKGEKEKRRCLLNLVCWSLGFGEQEPGLTSKDLDNPNKSNLLQRKLLLEWVLWKWSAVRDYGLSECEETKGYELWSRAAFDRMQEKQISRSKITKKLKQEHPIPRNVLADKLLDLERADPDVRNKVEDLLCFFCLEVTVTPEEANTLDSPKKLGLRETAPEFDLDDPTTVWSRYRRLREFPGSEGFEVILVPWWKYRGEYVHVNGPAVVPVFP